MQSFINSFLHLINTSFNQHFIQSVLHSIIPSFIPSFISKISTLHNMKQASGNIHRNLRLLLCSCFIPFHCSQFFVASHASSRFDNPLFFHPYFTLVDTFASALPLLPLLHTHFIQHLPAFLSGSFRDIEHKKFHTISFPISQHCIFTSCRSRMSAKLKKSLCIEFCQNH